MSTRMTNILHSIKSSKSTRKSSKYVGFQCYILALMLTFGSTVANATCSSKETVGRNGYEYYLLQDPWDSCQGGIYPLDIFLKKNESIRIKMAEFHKEYFQAKNEPPGMCTGGRGEYEAMWQIEGDGLYIEGISYGSCAKRIPDMIPLSVLFQDYPRGKLADWYSGVFYTYGPKQYSDDQRQSERISICRGRVVKTSKVDLKNRDIKSINMEYELFNGDSKMLEGCN